MHCVKKLMDDMYWVGASDRRLALFENLYPVPLGISYNAYLVLDEKTILIDTVDKAVTGIFFENIRHALSGRPLDYLIVNHVEPDHAAAIEDLIRCYPNLKIVSNAKGLAMIRQFFDFDADACAVTVKEGETLSTGRHSFRFFPSIRSVPSSDRSGEMSWGGSLKNTTDGALISRKTVR